MAREFLSASARRSHDASEDEDEAPAARAPQREAGKRNAVGADDAFAAWKASPGRIDRLQDTDVDDEDGALAAAFEHIDASRGGQPLPDELRRRLEAELRLPLGSVRVHTDARAAAAAAAVGARAFALGDDLYFATGAYDPTSAAGQALIAHEVAHVAQQRRGTAPTDRKISDPSDTHEREAEAFAAAFVDQLGAEVGARVDDLTTYRGESAQLAHQVMAAGATLLHHIVGLAEASPQRDELLHELTAVQAMGRGPSPTLALGTLRVTDDRAPAASATPGGLHRADAVEGARLRAARLALFDAYPKRLTTYALQTSIDNGTAPVGAKAFRYVNPANDYPYVSASAEPFTLADYKLFIENSTTGTPELRASDDAYTRDLGEIHDTPARFNVARVLSPTGAVGRTYVFIMDAGKYVANVRDDNPSRPPPPTPAQLFAVYKAGVARLIPTHVTAFEYTYSAGTFDWETAPTSQAGADAYRQAMRAAIVAAFRDRSWDDYYTHVMSPAAGALFPRQYNGIIGACFEDIVRHSIGVAPDPQRPLFRSTSFTGTNFRMGDGSFPVAGGTILDAKAAEAGIDRAQCADYGTITNPRTRVYGYFAGEDPTTARRPYNSVVYTVPTLTLARLVKGQIDSVFEPTEGEAIWQRFYIEPAPDGMRSFKALFNPTLRFQAPDNGGSTYRFDSPPNQVPGVNVSSATFGYDRASGAMRSGSIAMAVDMGGAITGERTTKTVTPQAATAGAEPTGTVENRFGNFTSTLNTLLRNVTVDARLVEDGVEATLTLAAGAIQIPSFTMDAATLTARYTGGGLAITGTVGIRHTSGRISGSVSVGWAGGQWTLDGTATLQEGLIEGLSAVTLNVHHEQGHTRLSCPQASYQRRIGSVNLTGTVRGLDYDVDAGTFGGTGTITADLGRFGTVEAEATFANNELQRAQFTYDSPTFQYPTGSSSPAFRGSVAGTIIYERGAFSGRISGNANIAIAALQAIAGDSGLGLQVAVDLNADGTYGGTIGTTTPLQFGEHLRIPRMSCTVAPDGAVSGAFAIEVVGIRHLNEVRIACTVDGEGLHIEDAAVEAGFGSQATGQFWGTLRAGYNRTTGLSIGGDLNYQIKEGMVARGTMTYEAATQSITMSMTVDEIKLLESQVSRQLFSASKQIPVFNFWGLGIYLDLGFDLGFDFGFDLGVRPTVTFEGFSLSTFEFRRIGAELTLLGDIYARLTGTPRLGIGIFALSPSLLRGGGGVRIPIVGEAHLRPTGTVSVGYTPGGGLESAASIGLAMTFGITGSVVPYAELSVLDGMWNPSWTGDALANFEILPPRELFNLNIDLAGDMNRREPALPGANAAPEPTPSTATNVLPQENNAATERSGPAASNTTEGPTTAPAESGNEGPFSLAALAPMIDGLPGVAPIKTILRKAGEVWGQISGFFGRVMGAFRDYFARLTDQLVEILDGFAAQGLRYLPQLIRKIIGEDAFSIVEPLLNYFVNAGQDLIDIFTQAPPTNLGDLMPWVWTLVQRVFNLGGGLGAFISAIGQMLQNLDAFTRRLVARAVTDGWIGVKRHHYYIWRPWPWNDYNFLAAAEYKVRIPNVTSIGEGPPGILLTPGAAVAIGLYELLGSLGVPVTYAGWHDACGEPYNDRWRGEGQRG